MRTRFTVPMAIDGFNTGRRLYWNEPAARSDTRRHEVPGLWPAVAMAPFVKVTHPEQDRDMINVGPGYTSEASHFP